MTHILVTNDDGVSSPGLLALKQALEPVGRVSVIAPDSNRSAIGRGITIHNPLHVEDVRLADGSPALATDGTPVDCVRLAMLGLLDGGPPDVIVSGINLGVNLGDDVTYSGTVASAMEATLQGIPAFAISVAGNEGVDFGAASACARRLAREVLRRGLPQDTLLNINVPNLPLNVIRGWAVTRQGRRVYSETVVRKTDPRGNAYYWIGGASCTWRRDAETDYEAMEKGWVSLTPLHLDLTNHRALDEFRGWGLSTNGDARD